jgi:hypothetical protein
VESLRRRSIRCGGSSRRAIAVNVLVIRTFVQLRRAEGHYAELRQQISEVGKSFRAWRVAKGDLRRSSSDRDRSGIRTSKQFLRGSDRSLRIRPGCHSERKTGLEPATLTLARERRYALCFVLIISTVAGEVIHSFRWGHLGQGEQRKEGP